MNALNFIWKIAYEIIAKTLVDAVPYFVILTLSLMTISASKPKTMTYTMVNPSQSSQE